MEFKKMKRIFEIILIGVLVSTMLIILVWSVFSVYRASKAMFAVISMLIALSLTYIIVFLKNDKITQVLLTLIVFIMAVGSAV